MIVAMIRRACGRLARWLAARVTTDPGPGWRPSRKRNDLHFK
jgi:hypothetical protein